MYTFTQTVTKTGYASSLGIKKVVSTFQVQMIDPCKTCVLQPAFTNLSLYAIISQENRKYVFLDYADNVSLQNDSPAEH